MDMREHNPMYEQSVKLADAPKSFPPWNCDAPVLKIRAIDGCTPGEAKRRVVKTESERLLPCVAR